MENNKEKTWVVYRHIFPNRKSYIGITCQNVKARWKNGGIGYLSKNPDGTFHQPVMANAVLKYGWDNIAHEILFENLTNERANRLEQICIILFRTTDDRFGYNTTSGGDGSVGRVQSEETKRKIGEKAKIRMANPENNPRYGAIVSNETKEKISKALKGKYQGENAARYGKKHTNESKALMKEKHTGKKASEETRKKMSESQKGKHSGKNSANAISVICLNDGEAYISTFEAGQAYNISPTTVRDICSGRIAQACGLYFMIKNDFSLEKAKEKLMVNNRPQSKGVICIETGEFYLNYKEARKMVGVAQSSVRACCLRERNTAKNFHWRIATEEEWRNNREKEIETYMRILKDKYDTQAETRL